MQMTMECDNNRKTSHLKYGSFVRASYQRKLDPNINRVIFKARTTRVSKKMYTNLIKRNVKLIESINNM